jgi:hypothetical protein
LVNDTADVTKLSRLCKNFTLYNAQDTQVSFSGQAEYGNSKQLEQGVVLMVSYAEATNFEFFLALHRIDANGKPDPLKISFQSS